MVGYLIFASANLLGYTGGFVAYTAFQVYGTVIDWPTFLFVMYNFAVGGVTAVFWQKVRVAIGLVAIGRTGWLTWLLMAVDVRTGRASHSHAGVSCSSERYHGVDCD
jgi:hypothetical protein